MPRGNDEDDSHLPDYIFCGPGHALTNPEEAADLLPTVSNETEIQRGYIMYPD